MAAQSDSIEFIPGSTSLIQFANRFGTPNLFPPLPLRRTCSILREFGLGTIVCERSIWQRHSNGTNDCSLQMCGLRFESCRQYIDILDKYYGRELVRKECFRIAFFRSKFNDLETLQVVSDDDIIAFCIVHMDTLLFNGINECKIPPYVTESIINVPERRSNSFSIGKYQWKIEIGKRKFKINGNYFSQQNDITNCCAHAAIKMAVRGFYPEITAEEINKHTGIDHKNRKGNDGLKPKEFVTTIKKLTDQQAKLFEARSFKSSIIFSKLIYHAIESRFPVILLFAYDAEKGTNSNQTMHAVTIIGHTFNKNNWWAYAWNGYFPAKNRMKSYLPSVIWCDNFIVQDDNFGPYYLVPLESIKFSGLLTGLPRTLWKLYQNTRFQLSRGLSLVNMHRLSTLVYRPLNCIILYPSDFVPIEQALEVEPYSLEYLESFAKYLKDGGFKSNNVYYNDYFCPNLKRGHLVLRTFALSKEEYLDKIKENYELTIREDVVDALKLILPSYLWVTEFSVPELYWVNFKKIGEILIDPFGFKRNPRMSVKFIKLPGLLCFFKEGKIGLFSINEPDSRKPLMRPECRTCYL